MKKIISVFGIFLFTIFISEAQDFKVGIRVTPLNSNYFMDDMMNFDQSSSYHEKYETRYDSLTIGLFAEKYFSKKSFLLKLDFNYADLTISNTDNQTNVNGSSTQISETTQVENQKYYNFNLGIGDNLSISKLKLSFGIYAPITILPKGSIKREGNNYTDGVLQSNNECTGKYKGTLIYGIGTFAGISTILFNHLSIGAEFTYQIQRLSRKLDWHGETHYYGTSPYMTYDDEKITFKNYFSSKLTPTIVIAYTFDWKKKSDPLIK